MDRSLQEIVSIVVLFQLVLVMFYAVWRWRQMMSSLEYPGNVDSGNNWSVVLAKCWLELNQPRHFHNPFSTWTLFWLRQKPPQVRVKTFSCWWSCIKFCSFHTAFLMQYLNARINICSVMYFILFFVKWPTLWKYHFIDQPTYHCHTNTLYVGFGKTSVYT